MNEASALPRLAATVLLLREGTGGGEVLLIRRHSGIAHIGGVWVFPGGKQELPDLSDDALALTPADQRTAYVGRWGSHCERTVTRDESLGAWITAARETFEETGILVARQGERPCPPAVVEMLMSHLGASGERPEKFVELLASEGLVLDVHALVPWMRWITPSGLEPRFDTLFFAAALPAGQRCVLNREATEHRWLAPRAALAAWKRGEIGLVTPTAMTLLDLDDTLEKYGSIRRMLDAEANRAIHALTPKLRIQTDAAILTMPWHPEYSAALGEGIAPSVIPPGLIHAPSRLRFPVLPGGGAPWSSVPEGEE